MAGRTPLDELLIVDVDVHVHESPGGLAPYCDAPWDVALRNVADVPERYLDIPGFSPGGDGTLTARFPTSHEATRMVHSPEQMVSELGEIGVDLAVLFPDHLLKLAVLPQADYAAALARAYNAWLIEEWTSRHPALLAAIVACPQDPEDAAREIERHADHAVARLPAVRRPRPAVGRPPLRPDLRRGAERRPAGAAARGDRHLAGLPVQQPPVRHRVRAPLDVAHVLDHGQRHLHGLDGRGRALPAS